MYDPHIRQMPATSTTAIAVFQKGLAFTPQDAEAMAIEISVSNIPCGCLFYILLIITLRGCGNRQYQRST